MKKWLLAVAATVVAVMVAFSGVASAQSIPPHKDPAAEGSEFSAVSLLQFFGTVLTFLSQRDYIDVSDLLDQLSHANIPEDIRFVIERYRDLLRELRDEFDTAESSLRRAAQFLETGDRVAARRQLESAGSSIDRSRRLLDDLNAATEAVALRVGVFSAVVGSPLRQMYERLQLLLTRLDDIWAQYLEAIEALKKAVEAPAVGSESIPENISLSELVVLTPALSALIAESSQLYLTSIEFDSPAKAYPGRAFRVSGQISVLDGPPPASSLVRVLLNKEVIASFQSEEGFERDIDVPANATVGLHILTVELPPHELYAGATASRGLEIVKASPQLQINSPFLALPRRSIFVSGELASSLGPLRDARVDLMIQGSQTSLRTDELGRFSGSIESSPGQLFLGPQWVVVMVHPSEPWHSSITESVRLVMLNVANSAFLLIAASSIFTALFLAWRRRRMRLPIATPAAPIPAAVSTSSGATAATSLYRFAQAYFDPVTPQGRIVSAYNRAARLLESSLAVSFQWHFTLRDFLRAVGLRVGSAFAEITELAERALYSSKDPDENEAQRAEELAKSVQRKEGS